MLSTPGFARKEDTIKTQTNNIQNSMIYKWIRLDYKLGTKEKNGEIKKEGRKEIFGTKTNLRFCAI